MNKKLCFDGFASANPKVVVVVSNDPKDFPRQRAFEEANGSLSGDYIGSEYFSVPDKFDPLGKTLKECRQAGCYEVSGL